MSNKEKKEHHRVVVLLTCIVILLLIILFSSIFYIRSTRTIRQAQTEAVEIAEKYTDLKNVDEFYWFTRGASSFSLIGKDQEGQEIVVFIPKSGEKVSVYDQSEGLTAAQAKQLVKDKHPDEVIQKENLGLYQDQPTWEVMTKDASGQLHYYLLDFKSGEEISAIHDI